MHPVKMKRTAVVALQLLLLVLLQNSLPETEAADALKPSDELKHLRDIMYQQGTALAELKTEMKYMEKENTALKTNIAKQIKETKEVRKELSGVKAELNALQKENTALKGRLTNGEEDVKSLKKVVLEQPKVAFSATLNSDVGPLSADSDLVFSGVNTNIGGAYNPKTGLFTAPVRGVYYFHFTICSSHKGQYSGIYLKKNNNRLTGLSEYNYDGYSKFISGGVTVQLERGDVVHARIYKGYFLCGYGSTFSGFLFTVY
ncbi:hypothetical protein NFI96_022118 [Prochilodus magdalenae]|nr:hypothetical protein NFI96_022118 [Prochilodus magdalenae]